MRLLHFSDLHLGVENYGSFDSRTGLSTRVMDFLNSFDAIVERAIADRVDAVLFSGDAFKNRDPSPTLQREFAKRIQRLASAHIPIVLLIGNHDLPNVLTRATPVEIYHVLAIPGVHVCRGIERLDVETKSGTLQVVAVPWVTRSVLLSVEEYRDLEDTELERMMTQLISQAVAQLRAELDPTLPAVLMAHVSLQGASLGYEQSIMLGRDVTVGLDDLHAREFDYVALGHIHKHQQVGVRPPAVYAGSPERIDFGEEREAKGYVLLTIESGLDRTRETSWQFVELPTRPFKTLRIDAPGDDPIESVRREIGRDRDEIDTAIVRCIVNVDPGREKVVNSQEVRRLLLDSGAFHVAHIIVESETTLRARGELGDETARDSLRMLAHWVDQKNYDAALRERVLTRGRDLIERRRSLGSASNGQGGKHG